MKCIRCHRPALVQVNNKGYCRNHRSEANRAQAQTIRRIDEAEGQCKELQRKFLRARSYSYGVDRQERERARRG